MVIRLNKKVILPTVIVALAFSNTLKNMTSWLYPLMTMSIFLGIFLLSLFRCRLIKNNRIQRVVQIIKYGFIPYLIIYVYSICIILINGNVSTLFFRTTGSCFSVMSVALIVSAIVYMYGVKSVDLVCNGLLLEYLVELIFGIGSIGLNGFIEHLIDPLNTYQNVFERHDIGFALFLFLIYYILRDAHSHRFKIIALIFIEYMIMKRVAIAGFIISLALYLLVTWLSKGNENKIYKICFFALFAFAFMYLNFTVNSNFQSFMHKYGIYNRYLFVNSMSDYYDFSIKFLGQGYGFVSVVLPGKNIAGVTGFTALHNDILKDYIELGFMGFLIAYLYLFVYVPIRMFGKSKKKYIGIVLAIMIYMLVTLLTDNVLEYIAFMGSLMVILSSLKIEDEEIELVC